MTLTLASALTFAAFGFTTLGAGVGAFFGAYLKRKGENLATHEDVQRLVDQLKLQTTATESIRADISGKLWETQERWRLKKQLYVDLLMALRDGASGLNAMWNAVEGGRDGTLDEHQRNDLMTSGQARLDSARQKVQECFALATLVDPELADLIDKMWTDVDAVKTFDPWFLRSKRDLYGKALAAVQERGRHAFRIER